MHENRSDTPCERLCGLDSDPSDQHVAAGAILTMLLDGDYKGPWTVADLKSWLSSSDPDVEEALIDLRNARADLPARRDRLPAAGRAHDERGERVDSRSWARMG